MIQSPDISTGSNAPRILILDLASTRTGWAFWMPGDKPVVSTKCFPKTGDDIGWLLRDYNAWLEGLISLNKPSVVVFEAPYIKRAGGQHTAHITVMKLFNLAGHTEFVCSSRGLRCFQVKVQEWRTHFIKGNPNRADAHKLTKQVCHDRGIEFRHQDEYDAFAMLDFVVAKMGLIPDWPISPLDRAIREARTKDKAA